MVLDFHGVVYFIWGHVCKKNSSNLGQDITFSFAKTYFNSALYLTESKFLVSIGNFLKYTFSDTSF